MRADLRPSTQPAARAALALVSLALVTAGAACSRVAPASPAPRNLLIIAIDTLRPDYLGSYGRTPSPSPNLDRLAAAGVVFENATSHAPWTLPSFGTMLTSQYASTHRLWNFDSRLDESFVTLPEIFRAAGFATGGVGSHVFFDGRYGLQQGFDEFDDELAHKRGQAGWTPVTSPLVTEKAIAWLRAREGATEPWLFWAHYFDPHLPYVWHAYEEGEPEPPERERYAGEIRFTDHFVGLLLAELQRLGGLEDTAVLLVSDHGEAFGEHAGVMYHGKSLHREELRVPMILFAPGLEPMRIAAPVRTVDVLPTLLELFEIDPAGLELGELGEPGEPGELGELGDPWLAPQGRSLLPHTRGEHLAPLPELAELRLYPGHHFDSLVAGAPRWKLIARAGAQSSSADSQLYDIDRDLGERRDLAGRAPAEVSHLRDELTAIKAAARARAAQLPEPGRVELSADEIEHLEALGYIDASNSPATPATPSD